jgi:hypothetical protein
MRVSAGAVLHGDNDRHTELATGQRHPLIG